MLSGRREEAPAQPSELGEEVPSQLGPEEQELLPWRREGKAKSKFRDESEDSTFGKQQVHLWTLCLRHRLEDRV